MRSLAERFRKWFDYEEDAHEKVLASLETVPTVRRGENGYQKCLDLLGHIAAARGLWLYRMGVAETGPESYEELFPEGVTLDDARARIEAMHRAWEPYLKVLDDAELGRLFRYHAIEGDALENSVEDLLAQLFGHSFYHRGQIASLVRGLGGEPAVTDYVFWTRRAVE